MNQTTRNLGLELGGITDEPSLIPYHVSNMIKIDAALGQGAIDIAAREAAAAAQASANAAAETAGEAYSLADRANEFAGAADITANEAHATATAAAAAADAAAITPREFRIASGGDFAATGETLQSIVSMWTGYTGDFQIGTDKSDGYVLNFPGNKIHYFDAVAPITQQQELSATTGFTYANILTQQGSSVGLQGIRGEILPWVQVSNQDTSNLVSPADTWGINVAFNSLGNEQHLSIYAKRDAAVPYVAGTYGTKAMLHLYGFIITSEAIELGKIPSA